MNTISDEALYSATLAYWRFNGLLPELMPGPQKERTKNLVVSIIAAADAVRAREQSVTEREQAEQPEGITLDLDALAWASIKQAAAESNWIPHEHYTANDWTNDVCAFLRGDSEEQRTPQPSDSAVDEAVELLGEFQSVIGSRRPDDPDDGPYWDRISAAISALRTPSPAQVPEGWEMDEVGDGFVHIESPYGVALNIGYAPPASREATVMLRDLALAIIVATTPPSANNSQVESSEINSQVDAETPCSTHPDAPHGFDRNASHTEDRYVCECEGWQPPAPPSAEQ